MSVIFLVLLTISLLIDAMAGILKRTRGDAAKTPPAAPAAAPAAPAPAAAGSDEELLVLITAAVAACLGKRTDEIVVREIRKVENHETEWGRSGRNDALQ